MDNDAIDLDDVADTLKAHEEQTMNALVRQESGALALPEADLMKVLQSSLYPGAAPESIKLVIGYCKASGLDPMQKPVHIVPMWDAKMGGMRDVIMPGVNLYRTQAARSKELAGITEPEFGPEVTRTLSNTEISFPEWCRVTVKRLLPNGTVADFTAIEYWMENYAVKGGKEKSIAPNAMWMKRPRGQIAKCAEAQALRKAFPEIGSQNTAEEMEGKQIMDADMPELGDELANTWITAANACQTTEALTKVWTDGLNAIKKAKNMDAYNAFKAVCEARGNELRKQEEDRTIEAEAATQQNDDEFLAGLDAGERQ